MKKTSSKDYLMVIEWSEEDQCFIGSAPPLIGPCCHGKTQAEVLEQLEKIVQEWIDIHNIDGHALPSPGVAKYSGKFLLRTGKELHRFLAIRALQSGDSLNNFIVKRLSPPSLEFTKKSIRRKSGKREIKPLQTA